MSLTKTEKRKSALIEWSKYVDTLTPEEADILIKPIKDYLDAHPDNHWLPFDPTNPPAPSKDYRLMLKDPIAGYITDYHWHPEGWIYGNSKNLNTVTQSGLQYKLIKL